MTSLADAYEREANGASRRRVYAGTGLFAAGALLVVGGILAGATHLVMGPEPSQAAKFGARGLGLTLVCLGVPAILVGVFTVLPANRFQRGAAAAGAVLAVAGTLVLRSAYPTEWYAPGSSVPSTTVLAGGLVYALGVMVTFWCLFTAVATLKTRNAPGGTVSMTITRNGETRTVEVPREDVGEAREALTGGSFGGVGVFGGVETNEPATSDGGEAASDIRDPNADANAASGPDRYCGTCAHFDYVRTDDAGIQPYCGLHDERMDDMDACESWTANRER